MSADIIEAERTRLAIATKQWENTVGRVVACVIGLVFLWLAIVGYKATVWPNRLTERAATTICEKMTSYARANAGPDARASFTDVCWEILSDETIIDGVNDTDYPSY